MNNDIYVLMYCNQCIGTFNSLDLAKKQMEICKKNDYYLQKNEFSIHIKVLTNLERWKSL